MHNHDSLAKKYIYDRTTRHHRTSQFSEQTPTKSLYQASPYTPQKQPNLHIHTRLHNNTPIISAKFITSRADGYMTVRFFYLFFPYTHSSSLSIEASIDPLPMHLSPRAGRFPGAFHTRARVGTLRRVSLSCLPSANTHK